MAKLHPNISTFRPMGAGEYAERAVLQQLADGLPDEFDVFHSVDWSTVDGDQQRFGEVDVVVVDALGRLVLLEIKAGQLEEAGGAPGMQLAKRYGGFAKDVIAQSGGQLRGMRQRLHDVGFDGFKVAHLLVLPDHTLVAAPVGLPRERIVDASDAPELCRRVLQVINQGQAERVHHANERSRLLVFLANQFVVCPDSTARIGLLSKAVVRLSDGLATWVPRIQSDAGYTRLRLLPGLARRNWRSGCCKTDARKVCAACMCALTGLLLTILLMLRLPLRGCLLSMSWLLRIRAASMGRLTFLTLVFLGAPPGRW